MKQFSKKCEALFRGFTAFIFDKKYLALTIMLAVTAALAGQLGKITIDTRDKSFFHEDDPILAAYGDFKEKFGQDEIFIIAIEPEQGLNKAFFSTLYRLHHELKESVPYIDDITSLVNGRIVRGKRTQSTLRTFSKAPEDRR